MMNEVYKVSPHEISQTFGKSPQLYILAQLLSSYRYQVVSKIGDSFVLGGDKIVSQLKNNQIVDIA